MLTGSILTTAAARSGVAEKALGHITDRVTAALPQSSQTPLFTVTGGRVAVTGLLGEVTTTVQAQTTATKVVSNPATGSDLDLCTTADLSGKPTGTLLAVTGRFSDALQVGVAAVLAERPMVVPTGTIDLSCSASSTGAMKWTARWFAIDDGAILTAA